MHITRSRAAVVGFGGWGLQVMLHLWPRLRFIQEERQALGIEHQLPDLNRLTAFATLLPTIVGPAKPNPYAPFRIVRPDPDHFPNPFYVEECLATIRQVERRGTDPRPNFTYAERVEARLAETALAGSNASLVEVPFTAPPLLTQPEPRQRIRRGDLFRWTITWAEPAVRAILQQVIDPTRLDQVQTRDPLVQTTIYIVASLAEPLTSALVWPIVSEMVATLGTRNVVNVVALFATGSFATDDTRVLEEASAYMALTELEALMGLPTRPAAPNPLQAVVKDAGKSGWAQRVGTRPFSRIYLVDREKSNQALAKDALELAILAGNAIESFLVADSASLIAEQLGPHATHPSPALYSLLGAASDYVPLAQYVLSAVREESKRLVREEVLQGEESALPKTALADLRARPEDAIHTLLHPRVQRMFERLPLRQRTWQRLTQHVKQLRQRSSDTTPQPMSALLPPLRVAHSYILSPLHEEHLAGQRHLWQWYTLALGYLNEVANRMQQELETQHFEEAWGLTHALPRLPREGPENTLISLLEQSRSRSWATRHQSDSRTLPAALRHALHLTVQDIAAHPNGLLVARHRLAGWIEEAETLLDQPREPEAGSDAEWNERYDRRRRRWEQRFEQLAGDMPHQAAILARALPVGILLTFVVVSWLLYESGLPFSFRSLLWAILGCAALTGLLILLPHTFFQGRVQRLQQKRIHLAQERLSRNANQTLWRSLYSVYRHLLEDLYLLSRTVQQTIDELSDWSRPENPLQIPPLGIETTHLRVAHTHDAIWETIRTLVGGERNRDGKSAQELFRSQWQKAGSIGRNWTERGERLAQRVRLALELPLNQREQTGLLAAIEQVRTAQPDLRSPLVPEEAVKNLQEQMWCPFAGGPPKQREPTPSCTACPNLNLHVCPFSQQGLTTSAGWSLRALVDEYTVQATHHLLPERRMLPRQPAFIRQIAEKYAIERLLFGSSGPTPTRSVFEGENPLAFVEELSARAKPAANYDLTTPFAHQKVEVDFGITAEREGSTLIRPLAQRSMTLLSSYDPMALSMVRTLHGLTLDDLTLTDHYRYEYFRLAEENRAMLLLLAETEAPPLYGTPDLETTVPYEPIYF